MTAIRLGVAGAGVFGSYHAAKIAALPTAQLAGVFDADRARGDALADKHGAPVFDDYDKFLQALDGVVIAAPAVSHFELGAAALRAGKHVFMEKPVATTTAEARALVELADREGLIFQAGHQERYVCEAIGLFHRPKPPQRIESVRHVPFTGRCGDVSAVLDLMVHDLDIIGRLTGAELIHVSADGDNDRVAAELFLGTGTIAALSARRASRKSERRMTLVYDDGVIEFDFIRRALTNSTGAALSAVFDPGAAPLAVRDPLAYGAELYANSILRGETLGVSGEEAAQTIDWARRIERAAGIEGAGDVGLRERKRA